jgi:hypothetical protein
MGDFWGWGDPPAQRVFQGVTRLYMQGEEAGRDATSIYRDAFDLISELIAGTSDRARQIEAQLEPLRQNAAWLGSGAVSRRLIAGRLAHYIVPHEIAGDDPARATHVPGFNEPISPAGLFWPHARARLDAQRACLVSIAAPAGWYHSLWAPGYLWADTEGLWQFPGLSFRESMSAYHLENPALERAVGELARLETAPGRWALKTAPPVGPGIEENFPMVLRFVTDEGEPIASQLAPDVVARTLNADGMFDAAH